MTFAAAGRSTSMHRQGAVLADRYELSGLLATGGMGEVWEAYDRKLGRTVAAKVVKPEYAPDPVFRSRLHAEAKAAAAVRNSHVVGIYDVGEAADGAEQPVPYIIMELLPGESLSRRLKSGPLSAADTTDLVAQVADALAAAHEQGVVHRDIKPANLVRNESGHVTVLDFGIARAADSVALTATGQMLGTARYLSPEQVSGKPATAESDIYSLGVVAYECLTGAPPFVAGSDIATALAHRDQPVPTLPDTVPPDLADLVTRCLAKDPQQRPTAAEITRSAGSLDAATPAMAPVPTPAPTPTKVMPVPAPPPTTVGAPPVPRQRVDALPAWDQWRRSSLIGGVALGVLALVLLVGAIAHGGSPAAATGAHHSAKQSTTKQHPHSGFRTVTVRPSSIVGESYPTARAQLLGLGLEPRTAGAAATPTAIVGGIAPTGKLRVGRAVVLTLLAPSPAPKQHPAPPHPKPKPHLPPGHDKVPPGHAKHDDKGPGGEGRD
jgi:serine/threonine protein kinase